MTTHRPSSRPSFSDHARTATDRGPASDLAIGVDVGTSGVGVVALDRAGRVVATADHPVPLATPQPGWTEQDPSDWVAATQAGLASVAKQVGADRVVALGLSGQMHGMVATDANGRVLRPALLWNDQRTAAEAAEIDAAVGRHRLIARTGNPAITGFQLPKVLWLRRHEPQVFARTTRVALPKDHVATVLTGDATAEPTDASGTGAYELRTGTWDTEVLAAVDLDPSLWPRLVRSHEVVGPLRAAVAEHVGLRAGLPVVAGAGDNAAASTALALGARHREVGSVSLGTSGVLFAALEEPTPEPEGRVHLFAHADGGFNLLGVTLSAAGSLRWYRDVFAPNASYDELMAAAADSPPGANGVTFKPYLAGERSPHLRPDLRGSFHGLSLATSRADVVRAVIEGVAFSLRETYDVMSKIAAPSRWLATGGGAKSDLWLTVIATLLGAPVGRPAGPDGFETSAGAAEGAAWLAWRALGHDPDRQPRAGAWLEPDERSAPALEDAYQRYLALGPRG
ncbi:MAG TPA: xylulokinase [Trueperaceae bacterium]